MQHKNIKIKKIKIGLDIATHTGYCVILGNKIIDIGVKKIWYNGDYEKTINSCADMILPLLHRIIFDAKILSGYSVCIELSKYGNNTTHIFSMLTGIILDQIYAFSQIEGIFPNFKLIDPKTWQKHIGIYGKKDIKLASINHANKTILEHNISTPIAIKSDDEADAFNIAFYGPELPDINQKKK